MTFFYKKKARREEEGGFPISVFIHFYKEKEKEKEAEEVYRGPWFKVKRLMLNVNVIGVLF